MKIILSIAFMIAALPAGAGDWQMLDDSEFLFEASFEGSPLPGQFNDFKVLTNFDAEDPDASALTVSVALAGADMDDPDINEAIAEAEWFDAANYPKATYKSRSIVATASGEYVAEGELDLKGVRKAVDVPFSWSETDDLAKMSGEFVLKRTDFGIGSGEWADGEAIGIDVRLKFDVRFERR